MICYNSCIVSKDNTGGFILKKGLILEGGAMRGLFTAGIIDVLMEENIEFDGVIGVSAGACFGCNYKSKQIGRVLRYNKNQRAIRGGMATKARKECKK